MNEFSLDPVPEDNRPRTSTRRQRAARFVALAGAAAIGVTGIALLGTTALSAGTVAATPSPALKPAFGDIGLVSTAPNLPAGFKSTFKSRFVRANGIRQHVVVGGEGPPVLLVHGWPENWYAWRHVMPELAKNYTVIAVDQRGIGRSQKTASGYDAATLADDLAALMTELGHEQFAVVGHDTGAVISYALAADHRDRVERLAFAEIPGPPGVGDLMQAPAPPMFVPEPLNDKLWHIPFNRVDNDLILDMVSSNADAYYRYEYSIQGGGATLPDSAIEYYIKLYTRNRKSLRASFGLYRAWDDTLNQNREVRQATKLTIPVLGIGGENSWGDHVGHGMEPTATDVTISVLAGSGHWVAEQAPKQLLAELTEFLAPYAAAAAWGALTTSSGRTFPAGTDQASSRRSPSRPGDTSRFPGAMTVDRRPRSSHDHNPAHTSAAHRHGPSATSTSGLLGKVLVLVAAAVGFAAFGAFLGRDLPIGLAITVTVVAFGMLITQALGGQRFRVGGFAVAICVSTAPMTTPCSWRRGSSCPW